MTDSPAEPVDTGGPRLRRRRPLWEETTLLFGVALVLAIVIKALFLQAFYIPSQSMEPGLAKNDRILVEKPSYWFGGSPQRGDVVVFKDPGDWLPDDEADGPTGTLASVMAKAGLYPSGGHLVKRVIGVAGDTITCCDDRGRILVNGTPLNEDSYIAPQRDCNGPMTSTCSWTAGPVPAGHIFVMGDNRDHSADSTVHMCSDSQPGCVSGDEYVDTDLVVGRVFALVWPRDRFTVLHRPATFSSVKDAVD